VPAVRLSVTPSTDPADYPFHHDIRVRFAETDAMGVVHHAAYLPYLEEARVAYLRHLGHPYDTIRAEGIDFTVLEAFVRYERPLRFDDVVRIHLTVATVSRATFQLAYLLTLDDQRVGTGVTVHGSVDTTGRAAKTPEWIRAALSAGVSSGD
jgi:acyl-CoA thioester hydrolase